MDDLQPSDEAPPAPVERPCTRVMGDSGLHCGATPTTRFVAGWYCDDHAPAYVRPPADAPVDRRARPPRTDAKGSAPRA